MLTSPKEIVPLQIGRGAMGVVYRAEHINLQRRAAIKIIAPDLAESVGFRERFTREARIAAALQHPLADGGGHVARVEERRPLGAEAVEEVGQLR